MKLPQAYSLVIFFSLTTIAISLVPRYAKPGCNDMCGSVRIPYPFGIGANCSINTWYTVECNSSTPYLSALNQLQVLGVNLELQTVTVNTPKFSDCQNPVQNSINFGRSPFLVSKSHNKFVFEGCGSAVMMDHGNHVLTGCSTNCHINDTTLRGRNKCFGNGCCQSTIPHYVKSYSINIIRQNDRGNCGSAFLVDENSYVSEDDSSNYVPISLLWTLSQRRCHPWLDVHFVEIDLGDGTTMNSCKCVLYGPEDASPYLYDPSSDNAPLDSDVTEECTRCLKSGNHCHYEDLHDPDGVFIRWNFICRDPILLTSLNGEIIIPLADILVISICMGIILLVPVSCLLCKVISNVIKKTKDKRQRKRFFKRNGGLLLKQQEEPDMSLACKTILFTSRELEKATNNFHENRILGRGGQGTVYKGMLVDGRIVAVKKSKIIDESQLEQFINEVVILSQINHRNVVKLLGCCLETDVPMLVSEFIPNGTLYHHLHNQIKEFPISLNMRLQIAREVAGALAYLHSASSIPIYHRDIKTTNILLDDKYRAKVSDFGTSKFVAMDQTHLTTLVKGTFGYLDPEYFESGQFTEKSDVFSFGVVLVELLTREKPISVTRFGEDRNLATHFMLAMEERRVMSIFDKMVIKEGTENELLEVANLAMRCLNLNGKYRPTMKEVAIELETIRTSHIPSISQTTIEPVMNAGESSMQTYDESSSTFLGFNHNNSQ